MPGHTWTDWDAGSFLARAVHHGPQPILPLCLPPSVLFSAFSHWCLRIVMQSRPGRDGGVLLSPVVEMLVRSQGCHITWDVHPTFETRSLESEAVLLARLSQENLTPALTFSKFPERW